MTKHQVDVWLSKFKMEERYELKELLTALGMGQAFSDAADFSAMTEDKEPICIGSVVYKTFLEVDEEGAEAAAATGATIHFATALLPQAPAFYIKDQMAYTDDNLKKEKAKLELKKEVKSKK